MINVGRFSGAEKLRSSALAAEARTRNGVPARIRLRPSRKSVVGPTRMTAASERVLLSAMINSKDAQVVRPWRKIVRVRLEQCLESGRYAQCSLAVPKKRCPAVCHGSGLYQPA